MTFVDCLAVLDKAMEVDPSSLEDKNLEEPPEARLAGRDDTKRGWYTMVGDGRSLLARANRENDCLLTRYGLELL
jgi:hypothetical protein